MTDLTLPPPCFTCGKELPAAFDVPDGDFPSTQAWGAVMFSSPGNFGSAVFDEMDGSRLVINICDLCLCRFFDRVVHSTPARVPKPAPILSRWEPPHPGTGGTE
jgi:hypothetical protein